MKNNRRYVSRFFAATLTVIFACTVLMPETLAFAARRNQPPSPVVRHRPPRPVVRHQPPRPVVRYHSRSINPLLPLGFTLLTIAGLEYYYNQGRYYRHVENRYVVESPPVGAVIVDLPAGHVTFWTGGIQYYYYGNAYYTRDPRGYVVVAPPYDASSKPPVDYQSASPAISQVTVMPPMLNVRSGPGINHQITFQVPRGMILEVHGTAPEWMFVKLPSGEFGWVMEKFTVSESVPNPVPPEG
ncbi:MAG: DUF6515 family protein [Syntrophales bacterium]|nr:DUF6515 family protein [Syntrophales bacterium]